MERDCGRRRRQKCTLFTRTIVGLIEPVRLVEVRSADDIASPADAPKAIAPQCESREGRPGSHVFPVEKSAIYTQFMCAAQSALVSHAFA